MTNTAAAAAPEVELSGWKQLDWSLASAAG